MGILQPGFLLQISKSRHWYTLSHTLKIPILTVAARRLESMMKKISGTLWGMPRMILMDTKALATTEIHDSLGNPKVVKRTLLQEHAKLLPPNLQSFQDWIIEDQWITTGGDDPQSLLIYDNGLDSPSHMTVLWLMRDICEGWNNAFAKLIRHAHPTIWHASIWKNQALASTLLLRDNRGKPQAKHACHNTVKLQSKLMNLCTTHQDGVKSMEDTLKKKVKINLLLQHT